MLRVRLVGGPAVEADGAELTPPASRRAWALLAWLALHPGEHPRGEVAAAFWPDVRDQSARASLRSAVWALRRALGDAADGHLVATRDSVGLVGTWVDVHDESDLDKLDGELLPGFDDDWALRARDDHRDRVIGLLEAEAERCDDPARAVALTRRQVALDPLGEEVHRRLMRRLDDAGDRPAALAAWSRFSERLRRELGVAPSAATRELAQKLRAHTEERAPAASRALPLVGRERELRELLTAWEAARGGLGGVFTIRGEPGIGKTRLAQELVDHAARQGALTATGAALDIGGGAPFGIWAELVRELMRSLPEPPAGAAWAADVGALVPELAREPSEQVAPDVRRARLLEAVAACVEFAARDRPVALVIEDAHAADAPSLELIAYVGRRLARLPILLAVTRRELPRRPDVDAVEHELRARGTMAGELLLDPLESDAVATLARSVAALEPDDVDAVVGHADGNALLAVETARAVARGESGPAASLRGAVRAAFRSLPSPGRRVAELAAVAARPLERLELRTLGIAEPAAAASQALDTGVMTSASGGVGYRHALLRDAAYADLAEPRRAELHEQLANALAEADPSRAGEAARHFRLAGRDDLAVDQLVRAAEHARSVTALDQAAELLAEAIEIVGEEPELLLEMGELEAWLGRREAAEAAFDRALPALERRGGLPLADAWLQRGRWYHGPICHPRLVREVSQEALRVLDALPGDHSERRQEATAAIAWVEAVDGDVDRAEELIAGLANAPRESAEFAISDYDLGHARALALVRRGRFEDAYEPSILAGRAADRCGRPDLSYGCWMNAAGAAAAIGDHERALEFLDQTMRSVGGRGMLSAEIQALAARAAVLTRLGRLQEAKAVTEQQREIADRTGHPQLIATAAHDRAMVALATGDYECAERLIKEALDGGATVSRPIARLTRAEALARLGRCDEAEEEIRATALEPVRPADFPETLVPRMTRVQGLVAAARGDDDLAARRLEEAADGWRRSGRGRPGDRMATVLTDFGRPVLGAVDTGWELDRVLADIEAIRTPA